jgi:hypothetical protein
MRIALRFILVAMLFVAACGDDDGGSVGQACTAPTDCDSNVCLQGISCVGGKTIPSACSGPSCTGTGTGTCSSGMQCVAVTGTTDSYCLPPTLCQ